MTCFMHVNATFHPTVQHDDLYLLAYIAGRGYSPGGRENMLIAGTYLPGCRINKHLFTRQSGGYCIVGNSPCSREDNIYSLLNNQWWN